MAATLIVTTTVLEDQILIEAHVGPGADIPSHIFLYDNTGTDQLGPFFGVCALNDYTRFQRWDGIPIDIFANKYVRSDYGRKYVDLGTNTTGIESIMVESAKKFRLEYLGMAAPVTHSYNL